MVVDTAKHAVVVAEEVKNKAEVAEEETKDAVAAMRETEATEADRGSKVGLKSNETGRRSRSS